MNRYFNDDPTDAPKYNPDAFFPNPSLCKPGTRGTIEEDSLFLRDNIIPFLDHFWTPWDPAGGAHNAIRYAGPLFDEAVIHFADGMEEEAFFDFGRCAHILEDMGSVPHLFGDFHPGVLWVNASGFEKWCHDNREKLQSSARSETVESLPSAMEAFGRETYRTARISGSLNADPAHPLGGDLAMLFPAPAHSAFVPADPGQGIDGHWWIQGAGIYVPGSDPIGDEGDSWGPVPNLPGEDHSHFYFQRNQEHLVPANAWDGTGWVPNAGGHSLAQLWAGVGGLRATPEQEHALIPRAVEYVAGYMKHLWDFVNPPPHLSGLRIEQDQNFDGIIDPGADEVICDRSWVTNEFLNHLLGTTRTLKKMPEAPAMRLPVRIELRFSEPVRNVTVALGVEAPTLLIASGLSSERGPPTDDHPDGAPLVVLSGVDLSPLPDGIIALFVTAEDLSHHTAPVASTLDPDPSTRAGRLPDGSWRNIEGGGDLPHTDRNHSFKLSGLEVRGVPSFGQCFPGLPVSHAIHVRNLGLAEGTEASFGFFGTAPGWSADSSRLDGLRFPLPAPGPDWVETGASVEVACDSPKVSRLDAAVAAAAGHTTAAAGIIDLTAVAPLGDHPDDTQSVTNRRFPTPWPVDTGSPIGILLNGWGAGIGHLLGRYGIATAPVSPDLRILGGGGADIDALDVLVVGSGGLAGLDRLPSFRERLDRFVSGGGVLIALTPQRGAELAALPGGRVAGFGWGEDQACFGAAARIAGRDAALAGQTAAVLDAGADGYLTRWPDDATILLERTSNGQPAMIAYRHGAGLVYALTLYPDWGYGAGQSSPAERALVRDLVTAALAWPEPIPEHRPGDSVALGIPVVNRAWTPTTDVSLEPRTPDRVPLPAVTAGVPLAPGGFSAVPLALDAPEAPGIYPVGYRLLDAGGVPRHTAGDVAFFAVHGTDHPAGKEDTGLVVWVTAPSDLVPIGGAATATVHVRNGTPHEFAGAIAVTWVHLGEGPLLWTSEVSIPAASEAAFPVEYPVFLQSPFTLLYGLFETTAPFPHRDFQSRAVASAMKGFEPFPRRATITLAAPGTILQPGVPLGVTARLAAAAPSSFDADVSLRLLSPANRELWTETRRLTIPATGAVEFPASVLVSDGEPGYAHLVAEVRADGIVAGQGALILEMPPLSLEIVAAPPQPWDPEQPSEIGFTVRNAGSLATPAGALTAALADPANVSRWSGSAAVPGLPPGGEATVAFVAAAPGLPFGNSRLRYAVDLPGGRFTGFRPLRKAVSVTLTAAPEVVGDGGTLGLALEVANIGDFSVSGTLTLDGAGLFPASAEEIALAPGAAVRRGFSTTVTESTPIGTHSLAAGLRATDVATATARVVVPPARLDFLPPPDEVDGGDTLAVAAVNSGRNTGVFSWSLRLLPVGAAPDDPRTVPLAQAAGTARLASAESVDLALPVPAGIATGIYALVLEAHDALSGLSFPLHGYVFVRGLSATLAVATEREVYAAGDPVEAAASLLNTGAPLEDAVLEWSVAGAGAIEPVAFAGTVHVSPAGDDALGDGSVARPFATPQRGVDAAPAGHRVLLLGGTYGGEVVLRPGTILQGEVVAGEPAAVIADADIRGDAGAVVDHLTVRNGNIIFPGAVGDVRVTDCVLEGGARTASPRGQGIVFQLGASRVLVGRNRLTGYRAGRAGVQVFGAAVDFLVHENVFSDLSGPNNNGVVFWGAAESATVQGNVFSSLAGGCNGVQAWGDGGILRTLRVLNNRFTGMSGGCNGVQVWDRSEAVAVMGNVFSALSGSCGGVHLWGDAVAANLSDNTLESLPGDASGIQLWGGDAPHRDIRIENNRLADIEPLDDQSLGNGIVFWERAERAIIARNVLERVTAGERDPLAAGILVNAGATALSIERNVVRESSVGVALRPPVPDPYRSGPSLESVTVANNLLAGNVAGFLEQNLREEDTVELRDSIVLGSTRAGILALGEGTPGGLAAVRHTDFFDNARDVEGRPSPVGGDGNLSADPLFADLAVGDLRLLPASPCVDGGSRPTLDIGPLDGDLAVVLGPRPVAPADGGGTHWSATLPIAAAPGESLSLHIPVEPLAAAGALLLSGRLTTASGQVLAEAAAGFTVQADPVLLLMRTPRPFYRPGEPVPVSLAVANTGEAAIADLLVRVTADGAPVQARSIALAPGEQVDLAFETSAMRDTHLHAVAGLAAADLRIRVAAPVVALSVAAPEVVGDEWFTVAALVANEGLVPADLTLDLAGTQDALTLAPGEQRVVERAAHIAADTVFVARLTGDATDAVSRAVSYGARLSLRLETHVLQTEGPAHATLVLANSGSRATTAVATLALQSGTGGAVGAWTREIWLAPGGEAREPIALGHLAPGEYLLGASAGTLAATAPLRVLPALVPRIVSIEVESALDGTGGLPVAVRIRNDGAAVLFGELSLATDFSAGSDAVALAPGEERVVPFSLPVAGAPAGDHTAVATLAAEDAAPATAGAPFRLEAALALTSVPVDPVLEPGVPTDIVVEVGNTGLLRGEARLRLTCGEFHDEEVAVAVGPGGKASARFALTIAADTAGGVPLPARVVLVDTLSGRQESRDFSAWAAQPHEVYASGSLDRPAYADGEVATLTMQVGNLGGGSIPLRALMGHADHRFWRDVTLSSAPVLTGLDLWRAKGDVLLEYGNFSGSLTASALDLGSTSGAVIAWDADVPAATALVLEVRTGSTPVPDEAWTPWTAANQEEPLSERQHRFLQYRASLSTATVGITPALREVRIIPVDPSLRTTHTTSGDFYATPLEIRASFPVDFSISSEVTYGVYAESGRALCLDTLPLRRATARLTAWTDRPRYHIGETVQLGVASDEGGLLSVSTPWDTFTHLLPGPGSATFSLDIPVPMASGSYLIEVGLHGERASVPLEIEGYLVQTLQADLDPQSLLPGEGANLSLLLQANRDLEDVLIEGWISDGRSTREAVSLPCALSWGLNRFEIPVPTGGLSGGAHVLDVAVSHLPGEGATPLTLASAGVWFEVLAPNHTPTADAGADFTAPERGWVRLDGGASADPDGDSLLWEWVQTAGPAVTLHGATGAQPLFIAPPVGREGAALTFALTVTDGRARSAADTVEIAVSDVNRPPVAVAGPDITRRVGEIAELDATGSHDPDGDPLAFSWELVARPAGSSAAPAGADQVVAALVPDVPGGYEMRLTVADGLAASVPDSAVVSTVNSRPRAAAGEDRTARPGENIVLDGSASDDPDGDPLSCAWTVTERPEGSEAALDDPGALRPSLLIDRCGAFVVELVVDDGSLKSEPDSLRLDCVNAAPVADAGPDRAARLGERVILDGSASHDGDADPLSFAWAFTARPAGSAAALDDPASATPSFVVDRTGAYALTLVVGDGSAEGEPDGVGVLVGTNVAKAIVGLVPASLRLARPAASLRARIELPAGFSASEIDPAAAAITAVGKRLLAKPVRRIAAKGAVITDADRDGRPEMNLHFPVKPLLRYLKAGTKAVLTFKGPLKTWGRFVGSAPLKIVP